MAKNKSQNVLITRFSALGDVAMTLPVIYGACAANPGMSFFLLTKKLPAKLFLCPPPNLTVIGEDMANYKGIAGLKKLLDKTVAAHNIDTVADLHDVLRTQVIRILASLKGLRVAHIHKGRRARKDSPAKIRKPWCRCRLCATDTMQCSTGCTSM